MFEEYDLNDPFIDTSQEFITPLKETHRLINENLELKRQFLLGQMLEYDYNANDNTHPDEYYVLEGPLIEEEAENKPEVAKKVKRCDLENEFFNKSNLNGYLMNSTFKNNQIQGRKSKNTCDLNMELVLAIEELKNYIKKTKKIKEFKRIPKFVRGSILKITKTKIALSKRIFLTRASSFFVDFKATHFTEISTFTQYDTVLGDIIKLFMDIYPYNQFKIINLIKRHHKIEIGKILYNTREQIFRRLKSLFKKPIEENTKKYINKYINRIIRYTIKIHLLKEKKISTRFVFNKIEDKLDDFGIKEVKGSFVNRKFIPINMRGSKKKTRLSNYIELPEYQPIKRIMPPINETNLNCVDEPSLLNLTKKEELLEIN